MEISKGRLMVGGLLMAVSFTTVGAGTAVAIQGRMFDANNSLQQALGQLQQADDDKGGHRVAAINLTQQAIEQVNLGIQFAAEHGGNGGPPPPPWGPPPPQWGPPPPP